MGITAKYNTPGQSYLVTEPFLQTTVVNDYLAGTVTTTTSNASRIGHYCSRSQIAKSGLSTFGNRRIRKSTSYDRWVTDADNGEYTRQTINLNSKGQWNKSTRVTGLFPIPWADIDNHSGSIGGYICSPSQECADESITKALNALGEQKVSIGAALAESRKTYEMLADTSINLFRSYKRLRKGDVIGALREIGLSKSKFYTGKATADAVLQVKYGWTPLLMDLQGGYEYFMDNDSTPLFLEAHGSSSRTEDFKGRSTTGGIDFSGQVVHGCRTSLKARVTTPTLRNLNMGGLINPLTIAWELVPFSFVLDWWMPIGNVLQAYTDSTGLSFVDGYTSYQTRASVVCDANYYYQNSNTIVRDSGVGTAHYFMSRRKAYSGFPRPGAYTKQGWFNKNKGATALALFRGLYR